MFNKNLDFHRKKEKTGPPSTTLTHVTRNHITHNAACAKPEQNEQQSMFVELSVLYLTLSRQKTEDDCGGIITFTQLITYLIN